MFRLLGLIIVIAGLYYSGAGTWAWNHIKGLDEGCYTALSSGVMGRMGVAEPVCGTVAKGIAGLEQVVDGVSATIHTKLAGLFGSDNLDTLDSYSASLKEKFSSLASSRSSLMDMVREGPSGLKGGGSLSQQLQQAVDSFTIGNGYLNQQGGAAQAVPWLQQGAMQGQGFGLMSQLTLGNMYAQGGAGIAQNPAAAQAYLQQAQASLGMLTNSNSPQAQQVLQSLPASPEVMKQQLEQAIRQLKAGK